MLQCRLSRYKKTTMPQMPVANSCGTSIIQKVMYCIDSCRQWAASSEEFFPSK